MERMTDTDYKYAKREWEDYILQNPGRYYDLYVQSGIQLVQVALKV